MQRIPRLLVCPLVALVFGNCSGEPSCDAPPDTRVGEVRQFSDHTEIDVSFGSRCERLSGTLFLPPADAPVPGMVFVHGAGETPRLHYGAGFLEDVVAAGIAVYSYDKRGVGLSEGRCCPGDRGKFELLAADAARAAAVLKARPEVEAEGVGFIGISQAGWVIPAAQQMTRDVSYMVIMSGPAVAPSIANYFDDLTDEGVPRTEALERLSEAESNSFDPLPYLERMDVPSLWLYGELDEDQPTELSVATLKGLDGGRITIEVFPGIGHDVTQYADLERVIAKWLEIQ